MDNIIGAIGELSCKAFDGIGAYSVANFIDCYGYSLTTPGWYIIFGLFIIFGGWGFFIIPNNN